MVVHGQWGLESHFVRCKNSLPHTSMLVAALFIIAKTQKQPKWPLIDEWIRKMWCVYIYIHTQIYIQQRNTTQPLKEWNNTICSNMNEPRDCHTTWSKSEKDKYHMLSLTCGSKMQHQWTHPWNRSTLTERTDLLLPKGRRVEEARIGSLGLADANYYS